MRSFRHASLSLRKEVLNAQTCLLGSGEYLGCFTANPMLLSAFQTTQSIPGCQKSHGRNVSNLSDIYFDTLVLLSRHPSYLSAFELCFAYPQNMASSNSWLEPSSERSSVLCVSNRCHSGSAKTNSTLRSNVAVRATMKSDFTYYSHSLASSMNVMGKLLENA